MKKKSIRFKGIRLRFSLLNFIVKSFINTDTIQMKELKGIQKETKSLIKLKIVNIVAKMLLNRQAAAYSAQFFS